MRVYKVAGVDSENESVGIVFKMPLGWVTHWSVTDREYDERA